MAIANTYTFNPSIEEIAEEAFERCGLQIKSGRDLRTARRSLNYLVLELANHGVNLWKIEELTWDATGFGTGSGANELTKGTAQYNIAQETTSLLDVSLRLNAGNTSTQLDYTLDRISYYEYMSLPNKLTQARPLQYFFNRTEINDGSTYSTITLWPTPDSSTLYQLVFWRVKRISDAGSTGGTTMDLPDRFIPAVTSGLAFHIANKSTDPVAMSKVQMLKAQYNEDLEYAIGEDRDKSSIRLTPDISYV